MTYDFETLRKAQENLVLLVIGAIPNTSISILRLEKYIFLLSKFNYTISQFIHFVPSYDGAYSSEIDDIIHYPYYRDDDWKYTPSKKNDKISKEYIELTETGKKNYQELYQRKLTNENIIPTLTAILIIRRMYDKLTIKKFLDIMSETYPEMTEKY